MKSKPFLEISSDKNGNEFHIFKKKILSYSLEMQKIKQAPSKVGWGFCSGAYETICLQHVNIPSEIFSRPGAKPGAALQTPLSFIN